MKKMAMYLMLALVSIMFVGGCSKVPAGHVGVKFNLYADDKGVQTKELGPGRYWVSWNEEIYKFPTFTQNWTWEGDTAFEFSDRDGTTISTDIGITYRVDPLKVTTIFQTYRKGIDEITSLFLRNMVRDSMVKRASNLPADQIYGPGKAALMEQVQEDVIAQTKDLGIIVEKIYLVGTMRLPKGVRDSIDAKIQATQFAHQRQNEVASATAEAEKAVATARGEADSKVLVAQGEAEAIRIKGDALRNNPNLVQLLWVEKWDGVQPTHQLGNTAPMFQVK